MQLLTFGDATEAYLCNLHRSFRVLADGNFQLMVFPRIIGKRHPRLYCLPALVETDGSRPGPLRMAKDGSAWNNRKIRRTDIREQRRQ